MLNKAGEIVAVRDGTGFLATEGADLAAKVSRELEQSYRQVRSVAANVELTGTGKPEEYFVTFFAKPGSTAIRDLSIELNAPGPELTPKIQVDGQQLVLVGTAGDDVIDVQMGFNEHVIQVNGIVYVFDSAKITEVHVGGAQGHDRITVNTGGGRRILRANAIDGRSTVVTTDYSVHTYSMEETEIQGRGVSRIELYGSQQSDQLESALNGVTTLTTPNHEYVVTGFERVDAYGRGGNDTAYLYGSERDDTFAASNDHAWIRRFQNLRYVKGFERVNALGRGGNDKAFFTASATRNRFVSTPAFSMATDESVKNVARGFADVSFKGQGGNDAVFVYSPATISPIRGSSVFVDRSDREESVFDYRDLFVDAVRVTRL